MNEDKLGGRSHVLFLCAEIHSRLIAGLHIVILQPRAITIDIEPTAEIDALLHHDHKTGRLPLITVRQSLLTS